MSYRLPSCSSKGENENTLSTQVKTTKNDEVVMPGKYLPDGLPLNRALWPEKYQELEQLDLLVSQPIRQLKNQKINSERMLAYIEMALAV